MRKPDRQRWFRIWAAVAGAASPVAGMRFERLVSLYAEPHRRYHTLAHIEECLVAFDGAREQAGDPVAVELAIWLHDAVYDPRASDNEERSAEIARDWLVEAGANPRLVDSVSRLILATKNHEALAHPDAALLVDVDLAIFAQAPPRFWEYEDQIRQEYHWVPDEVYGATRARILGAFLARDHLYSTPPFRGREAQARANLEDSIRRLEAVVERTRTSNVELRTSHLVPRPHYDAEDRVKA